MSRLREHYDQVIKPALLAEFKYTRMGSRAETLTIDLAEEPSPQRPEGLLFSWLNG